jgi:hypothetical protein
MRSNQCYSLWPLIEKRQSMFESIKNYFSSGDDRQAAINKLGAEADQFRLPSETLPQICKYLFFAGLAFLNFRLFNEVVPGSYGVGTGIVAILSEVLAIYCSHYFSRAASWFRVSLGLCGAVLMTFSLVHGTFSILDLIGVWEYSDNIQYYSRVVAFPLLAALIGLTVIALTMTHPHNIVRMKEAMAHLKVSIGRAEAASDVRLMRTQAIIEDARLQHRREQNRRESEYLQELVDFIAVKQQTRQIIQSIADPDLRESLAKEMRINIEQPEPPKNKPGFVQNQSSSEVSD